jgi:hypothetical protein
MMCPKCGHSFTSSITLPSIQKIGSGASYRPMRYDLLGDEHIKHLDLLALNITEKLSPNSSQILSNHLVALALGAKSTKSSAYTSTPTKQQPI